MKAQINIKMENAAFEPSPCEELARILHELAASLLDHPRPIKREHTLRDFNGNTVGGLSIN